jgi:hypothetical protein
MIQKRNVLFAVVAALAIQVSAQQDVNITGTVIDGSGNAVAGAYVSLLLNGMGTTSDSSGAFTISNNSSRAVGPQRQAGAVAPVIAGDGIRFSLVNKSSVKIDVFTLGGRLVLTAADKMLAEGSYSFTPAAGRLSRGIYLVKVRIGTLVTLCRLPVCGGSSASPGLRALADRHTGSALSKAADVQDTLAASKGGFKTFKKFITSYTLANQICVLTAVPKSPETAIYSERITKTIDWAHTDVQVWDYNAAHLDTSLHLTSTGLNGACTANPYPGNTKCWSDTCGTVGWSTWGFVVNASVGTVDMSGFYGGNIHFYIRGKTPSLGAFIGWLNGSATTVDLSTVGYSPDSAWHEVTIPLASFGTVDLANITDYLMFVAPIAKGGAYVANSTYALDDITWRPAP